MADRALLDEEFRRRWQARCDELAETTGLRSVLVMKSLPQHMEVVVSSGPAQEVYHPCDRGPKSVVPGHHKLYCEHVVNTGEPLHVPDAAADPQWAGNADLVEFGLGCYLGFPVRADGENIGTVCALRSSRPLGSLSAV